ncbi:MAG: hypothetical protein R3280_03560 [Marinobacter sp.]|uniref:hypothetical protein n=1 Tax=Marinobacter sp. TaxID=50741 RepID=UPI00299E1CEF|nr:hypothetical protein [Marinobacter sp.]MDX1633690.1 hypothetical protein [Marinobacter sp.]
MFAVALTALLAGTLSMASLAAPAGPAAAPEPVDDWTDIVRSSPYWVSQGVHDNILTIRRWVLTESAYCDEPDRHILFDVRGEFLGWIEDAPTRAATQTLLNETRARLAADGRVSAWARGDDGTTGYPFALACDQPHVNLDEARARYLGTLPADRVWGTWDDLVLGTPEDPRPLHEALDYVFRTRQAQGRLELPEALPRYLAGQILIESGGQVRAHSIAGARGILQLLPAALDDCGVPVASHWHRMAQIDCALKLMHQNARNLRPAFEERFGGLPADKRDRLFTLLLIQAYHGGLGRITSLLSDDNLARPARYFARYHERFSAGDIAFGLIFHNLGRDRFGLASLYYVADVQLATAALCNSPRLRGSDFCR